MPLTSRGRIVGLEGRTLCCRWLPRSGPTGLELNYAKGWSGDSIDFVAELSEHMVQFTIIDHHIKSVEAIHSLRLLKSLDVNTYCRTHVNLSSFPMLRKLALEWRKGVNGLAAHPALSDVWLNKPRRLPLEEFSTIPPAALTTSNKAGFAERVLLSSMAYLFPLTRPRRPRDL